MFEERIDIPVSDLEDFVAEAILLTPELHEIDPVSGFVVTDILLRTLQTEDDGTAMFLPGTGGMSCAVISHPSRMACELVWFRVKCCHTDIAKGAVRP